MTRPSPTPTDTAVQVKAPEPSDRKDPAASEAGHVYAILRKVVVPAKVTPVVPVGIDITVASASFLIVTSLVEP